MEVFPVSREEWEKLWAELRALREENAKLKARVAELERELAAAKKSSRNSSKPPSTEHPHAKIATRPKKSNGKRGGQPGHERSMRELVPPERCDEIFDHRPTQCRGCGGKLIGSDPAPERKQIWEVPPIKPIITEHRLHRLTCGCCGTATSATWPDHVPTCEAGPQLIALTSTMMGFFYGGKAKVAQFVRDVFQIPCSPSWVVKLQNVATTALRPAYDELTQRLPGQTSLNIDESPTKQANLKTWMWSFVARTFTVFAHRTTRKAEPLRELLGANFQGVVGCDRAKMYFAFGKVQWCWAHLIRDFQSWIDSGDGVAKRLGHDLLREVKKMFAWWWRVRDGTLQGRTFQQRMKPIRETINDLLLRGKFSSSPLLRGPCRELYTHRKNLWTFVDHDHVEPTNNAAERALRQSVIWRKISFGTQSESGSRFVETLLTLLETCRQQSRNAFTFLTESLQAHFAKTTRPTLAGA